MKQILFMVVATLVGTGGVMFWGPFVPLAVYYGYAVLRPQYLWSWALPANIQWSQYVALAAIAGTVAAWLGILPSLSNPRLGKRTGAGHSFMLAFSCWIVLTFVTARNQEVAWPYFLEYLKIFIMFGVGTAVVTQPRQVHALLQICAGCLIYIAYEVNFTYFTLGRINIYNSGYGGLDNNGAGLMLAVGVPLAIFAFESTMKPWRWAYLVGVPLLLHAVLMTYSRGAMLALLIGTPYTLMRSAHKRHGFALAVVLALLVPLLAGQEIRNRFFSIQSYEEDRSANSRLDSWRSAFRIANESPIFGVGIRNSPLVSYQFGADMEGRVIHSQYLQIMADSGYVALFLYLGLYAAVASSLWQARRHLSRVPDDPDAPMLRGTASGIEGGLLVFGIGAAFLSLEVFELPYILLLMACQLWVIVRALTPQAAMADSAEVKTLPAIGGGISPWWVARH